jgi:hypothetical protein
LPERDAWAGGHVVIAAVVGSLLLSVAGFVSAVESMSRGNEEMFWISSSITVCFTALAGAGVALL